MNKKPESSVQKITVHQLEPGMYVLSVRTKGKTVSVKSEGYVSSKESILKLIKAGITHLTIDANRQKQVDKIMPEVKEKETPNQSKKASKSISLDQEMVKASKLYADAKKLQHKMLSSLTEHKTINIVEAKESTDAIVDSIFRNQDALACMTRLRIKDEYLVEHSLNVAILMTLFAKHLAFDREIIEQLALGAFLHDIGKVLVPPEILHKPGKLTVQEFTVMKSHVDLGMEVLKESSELSELIIEVVQQHHERLDGKGYPKQLNDQQITQYGRMIAIVDSYDAMTAERVYKAGMHPIKAFNLLMKDAPNSYDNVLVEQFVNCLGIYPIGTLVKLTSGKLGLISRLNKSKPLLPFVRVFYNTRLNQAIAMEELDLSQTKYKDQIDCCIKPDEFNINLLSFFKAAFYN
ncbi:MULTISPECIES: HD-GYP domain-containing protein [Colwellia]|uniref:Phosphodiesterase n=1 Tax=Colwellia marinimaniae TaxID=1513592 RepID=A0ABQ0MZ94_9GAMM|nr:MULTISPECIES: HD-GYP domain-containing protein [Colwellia]GAW97582.1 phosphodiesterase [Colwellia marinimaniae]